jgi:hypothetical protein
MNVFEIKNRSLIERHFVKALGGKIQNVNTMSNNENNKNKKDEPFMKKIEKRSDNAHAIMDFLKGLTVQECIDTLEAAKRHILSRAIN